MDKDTYVSVIIATLAESKRADSLKRAIQSVRDSSTQHLISIIVVVNGNRFDKDTCRWLEAQPDVVLAQIAHGSLPAALAYGRQLVTTEYFGFLDDDDEYLPDSIDTKLAALLSSPDSDLVISNGLRNCNGLRTRFHESIGDVATAPLRALFDGNWLASCGALYRSASMEPTFCEDLHPYAEWTWLAYRVALAGKIIATVDTPCFVINDTPGSLSKSAAFRAGYLALYRRMLDAAPPAQIVTTIKQKRGAAWHDASVDALGKRQLLEALKYHLYSLTCPDGKRYLAYTRRLIPGWPN